MVPRLAHGGQFKEQYMDELVTAVDTLLSLIPEQHRPWVEAAMALLYALGGVWAFVRWVVAKKLPAGREPGWFQAVDVLMQALTASSSRVSTRAVTKEDGK
jgi:hypothetical protein